MYGHIKYDLIPAPALRRQTCGAEAVPTQPPYRVRARSIRSCLYKTLCSKFEFEKIKMAISRLSIVKFLELALTCSCVAIHAESFNVERELGMLVTGTFVGYLIVFAGAAAGYVMQTPTHKRIDIFYSLIGVGLFVASGAMLIDRFHNMSKNDFVNKNLAKASLAIINAAVLLFDAIITQRGG